MKKLYTKPEAGMVWERGNGLHTFNNGIPSKVSDTTTMSLSLCTDSEDNDIVNGRNNDCTGSLIPNKVHCGGLGMRLQCIMTLSS